MAASSATAAGLGRLQLPSLGGVAPAQLAIGFLEECADCENGLNPERWRRSQTAATGAVPDGAVPGCVPVPLVNDKCPVWVSSYNGPANGGDGAGEGLLNSRVMAPSPDGRFVYVAGVSDGDPGSGYDHDFVVVAFRVATGEQVWSARYAGAGQLARATPFALVVDPGGARVFVTGTAYTADSSRSGIVTVGFSAQNGAQLWAALFEGISSAATDAAISADGNLVFVSGQVATREPDGTPRSHALTLAYNALNGQQAWEARYSAGLPENALAFKVAANPDGSRLYVAGGKIAPDGHTSDVVLLVYDPAIGASKKGNASSDHRFSACRDRGQPGWRARLYRGSQSRNQSQQRAHSRLRRSGQ